MDDTVFRIQEMDKPAMQALLMRHNVGRVAYSLHDRVDIEPISYIYEDGWIFGRTSPGSKLNVLARRPWVAFEVDEVHGPTTWESVVAHGTFYHLEPEGNDSDKMRFEKALAAVRKVIPETFRERDPVAFRDVIFGIHVDRMSGRACSPA